MPTSTSDRDEPTITVVVTSLTRPSLVRRALSSLNAQTSPASQIVVVDDGSNPRIDYPAGCRVIRAESPRGVCASRNAGLEAATSDFVTWLDDDDWLDPEFLAYHRSAIERLRESTSEPFGLLGTRVFLSPEAERAISPRGRVPRGGSWLRDKSPLVENTLLVPTEVARGVGGWDEQIRAWTGDDFFQRLVADCSLELQPQARYYSEPPDGRLQLTRNWQALAEGIDRTMAKHRAQIERDHPLRGRYLRASARNWLFAGQHAVAVRRAMQAARVDPMDARSWSTLGLALAGPHVVSAAQRAKRRLAGTR